MPWGLTEEDIRKRKDLRGLDICSIDPPGCTDIDDALHLRDLPNGNFEVIFRAWCHKRFMDLIEAGLVNIALLRRISTQCVVLIQTSAGGRTYRRCNTFR